MQHLPDRYIMICYTLPYIQYINSYFILVTYIYVYYIVFALIDGVGSNPTTASQLFC